ncbi:hypothetical protein [Lolliginicoccus suaedae]|uniref:hypothetical protein n=1 Tax=Lolliginicoccus suaedae TaxID=2605429 RepID=UPI0011EF6BD9|nr:hypothetical protein [Lolliginicoccus suaedae]
MMAGIYSQSREYFGGMSPWVPAVFSLGLVGTLAIGTSLGNAFLLVMALGWMAFLSYSVFIASSPTRSMRTSEVLPFGVGLIAATLMGVVGLTPGGFGDRWSAGSLVLAVLVGAAAVVTTRRLLSSGEQS